MAYSRLNFTFTLFYIWFIEGSLTFNHPEGYLHCSTWFMESVIVIWRENDKISHIVFINFIL